MGARRLSSLVLLAALSLACQAVAGKDPAVVRTEVEEALSRYLPKLGEAYASRDAAVLADVAVPKEVASVERLIHELSGQGRVLKPVLKSFTIEKLDVWNYSNAYVTTLEVWDLEVVAAGSEVRLSQSLGQRNRVRYQLKRRDEDEAWMVLLRSVAQTLES